MPYTSWLCAEVPNTCANGARPVLFRKRSTCLSTSVDMLRFSQGFSVSAESVKQLESLAAKEGHYAAIRTVPRESWGQLPKPFLRQALDDLRATARVSATRVPLIFALKMQIFGNRSTSARFWAHRGDLP